MIETAESRGDGRERLWQSVHRGFEIESLDLGSPESRLISRQLLEAFIAYEDVEMRRWLARSEEPGWLDTGVFLERGCWSPMPRCPRSDAEITALLEPYRRPNRVDPPADARLVPLVFCARSRLTMPLREANMKH